MRSFKEGTAEHLDVPGENMPRKRTLLQRLHQVFVERGWHLWPDAVLMAEIVFP